MRSWPAPAVFWAVLCALAGTGTAQPDTQSFETIERGRYLVVVGDCNACHMGTDGSDDFAGGRALRTPFGTLLGPNITPDRANGIGAWTDEEFANALRKGTGHDGTHIYPGMPYTYLTKTTLADVRAIRAYLATVKPSSHHVVSNQLPFPFDVRASLVGWDALYFKEGEFSPVPGKSDAWNRGAYLVQGLGHCGMCHTPKNALGGDENGRALQGGVLTGWVAPNITNDERRGLGRWSVEDVVAYLRSGHNAVAAAGGPMAEEVALSSSGMTDSDLCAIAVYLKDQPGQGGENDRPLDPRDARMVAGEAIYVDQCSACHAPGGAGVPGLLPVLAGAPSVQQIDPASLIRVVLQGVRSAATDRAPTGPAMPPYAWQLDDAEVAAVLTYVRNAWGNAAPPVGADRVGEMRKQGANQTD